MLTFIADLHLSLNNRINDFKKVLMEQVLPEANKSDKFYILGDIFHDRRPHPVEMDIFRDFISRLSTPTTIIVGNHDENLDATTLDEFSYWETTTAPIEICKPPHIEIYKNIVLYLDHAQYEGAKLGSSNLNLNIKKAKKLNQLPKEIEGRIIDFYILGHIHKAQILRENPPTLYVGSIEHIDFAERNEDKYMFQIDEKTGKYGYKKLHTRSMLQIDLDLSKDERMSTACITDAIVKVVIKGTKEQIAKFNEAPLLEWLKEAYKFSHMYNVIRENRVQSNGISEERSVIECFNDYAKLENFSEKEITVGIAIINEY